MVSKQKPVGLSCLHTTNEPRALLCAVVLDHISYRLWRGMCSDLNWATHSEYERLSNAVAILRTFTAEKECRSSAQQAMYCLTLWYRVQWFCRSLLTGCPLATEPGISLIILTPMKINWTMRNSQVDISSRMERHPTLHKPAWPKFSPFSVTASFRRDFGHRARPIWRRLIISYGDIWKGEFTKTNHEP